MFEVWIHDVVKPLGYRRKNKIYWLKFTDECLLFFYLQRSKPYYYLTLGVYVRALAQDLTFDNFKWGYHFGKRADSELGNLLDLSTGADLRRRELEFKAKLTERLVPELESMGTIIGIKRNIEEDTGFLPCGYSTLRMFGFPMPPRFSYNALTYVHTNGAKEIISYDLWERNPNTDEVKKIDTVYSIEEAESWAKKIFLDMTRDEAADLLVRFLSGKSEHQEFVHFLREAPKHDKAILNASCEIAALPQKFPANVNSADFCNSEGLQRIRELVRMLRGPNDGHSIC